MVCDVGNLDDKIKAFIEKYTDKDIDLSGGLIFRMKFQDFTTWIRIEKQKDGGYIIVLPNQESRLPCMELLIGSVFTDDAKCIGSVEFISSNQDCQIPKQRAGTWLMSLAEYIFDQLDMSYRELEDKSWLRCDENTVSLRMLRIYELKDSWYTNFGYKNTFEPVYSQVVDDYRYLSMKDISDNIEKVINNRHLKTHRVQHILTKIKPEDDEYLGQYMLRLWYDNCQEYEIFEEFLHKSSQLDKSLIWSVMRQMIENENIYQKHST